MDEIDELTKNVFGMFRKEWRICLQDPDEPIPDQYYRIVALDPYEALKVLMADYYSSLDIFSYYHKDQNINNFSAGDNYSIAESWNGREIIGEHFSCIQRIDPFSGSLTTIKEFKNEIEFYGNPSYDHFAKFGKFELMKVHPHGDLIDDGI